MKGEGWFKEVVRMFDSDGRVMEVASERKQGHEVSSRQERKNLPRLVHGLCNVFTCALKKITF